MQRATGNSVFIGLATAVLTAWAAPDLRAQDLKAEYWDNATIPATPSAPTVPAAVTRTVNDALIDYDDNAGTATPAFAGPPATENNFMVRWTGFVLGPTTGAVTFKTLSDDGIQVSVGGTVLFTDWEDQAAADNQGNFSMTQGIWYPIQILYYERTGDARMRLQWAYTGQADQFIPAANQAQTVPTPNAPVLSGTAGDLQTTFNTLNWTFTGTASQFTIYRSTDPLQQGTSIGTVAGTVLTYTDTSPAIAYNVHYYYRVTATNGIEGPVSNQVDLMPVPPPPRTKDHDEGFNDGNCACGSTARGTGAGIALLAAALLAAAFVRRATA